MDCNPLQGIPPHVTSFPGVDSIGARCRVAQSVSVMRYGESRNCVSLGDDVSVYEQVRIVIGDTAQHAATGLRIGARTIVNVGAYLSGEGGLTIGDDVLIGPHACLLSAGHAIHGGERVVGRNPLTHGAVCVEDGAWIAAGATILEGVRIGRGAVVAAGAVVSRDVPPMAIVAGVPASLLAYRDGRPLPRALRWRKALSAFTRSLARRLG